MSHFNGRILTLFAEKGLLKTNPAGVVLFSLDLPRKQRERISGAAGIDWVRARIRTRRV